MNTKYIDTLRNEYIDNHTRLQIREELISENNIEKRDIKGYHGREILELLQNADDAYQKSIDLKNCPKSELNVEINYIDDWLKISNTGTFFDEDGIKAIVQGNNSPKKGKYIGNKGTGFRSILNWADEVKIYSGEFAVRFSNEIAHKVFESIKDKEQIVKQLKKEPSLYIPMLAVPENIEHNRPQDRTTIEIHIDSEKTNDDYSVEKQLDGMDLRMLLFLPNISSITIITKNANILYKRIICNKNKDFDEVELIKKVDENVDCIEKFKLFRNNISKAIVEDDIEKDIQLAIAVPLDEKIQIKHLYSYFPLLDTNSPFNCVFHATYSLGDHRNTVNLNDINKRIIQEQLGFLVKVAKIFISNNQLNEVYKILLPTNYNPNNIIWSFSSSFSNFKLEDFYINLLSELSMFETVNNELVSIESNPKKINDNFPDVFKGEAFENLLKSADDRNYNDLIKLISSKLRIDLSISDQDLYNSINLCSYKWEIQQQVEVFKWWNEHYRNSSFLLPNLIKTQRDTWLKYNEECYFLEGDFDSVELPEWVEIQAIREDYQLALIDIVKDMRIFSNELEDKKISVIRYICQYKIFSLVNFKYRDRNNIISAVNASVKNDYNNSVAFVKWLWQYYGKRQGESWSYIGTSFNFPSGNKSVVSSNKLYFGKHYNNTISDKLFLNDFYEFPSKEIFDVNDNDAENFKIFIKKHGVCDFPGIEIQDVEPLECYDDIIKKDILITGVFHGTSTTRISYCKYKLPYISNLEEILQKINMLDVVKWILTDYDLYANLDTEYCSSGAIVKYHGNNQRTGTETIFSNRVRNYILTVFNNLPWIEINGNRYTAKEVLNGFSIRGNQKFERFVPVLTIQILENISQNLGVKINEVISVMSKFAFVKQVTDLPSNMFYGLMLNLQQSANLSDYELSKTIYRSVEHVSFNNKDYEDSENKKRFYSEGKLLVRHQGVLQYWPANQSYLPSSKIINKKDVYIVEKGSRTNNSNFVRVFGCKEWDKDYVIVHGTEVISCLNDTFQLYFKEYIKYARAYSERNENIGNNIDKLKITLVSALNIKENEIEITINENYSLLRDTITNWFVVTNDYNMNKMSVCIENIFTNIANTPGFDSNKLGELFRTSKKEDREFLIQKEFGSLGVIDDTEYNNVVKRNFIDTLKKISPDYDIEKLLIDFDEFESLTNSRYIIELFINLNIDIDDFRSAGFVYSIDIKGYLKTELDKFICNEKINFKNTLFAKACNDKKLQNKFILDVDRFENYTSQVFISNSVRCNPIEEIKEKFGEWQCDNLLSADEVYGKNYDILNPDNKYQDEISNNRDVQRMIYFNLKDEFDCWLNNQDDILAKQNITKANNVYLNFHNVIPEEVGEIDYSNNILASSSKKINIVSHRGVYTRQKNEIKNNNIKQVGNTGELLIYNYLCDKYGKENVYPRSEAFVDLGILKPGLAVSGDYDLSYKDNGKEIYVEVKTGNGKNMFFMSPGELKFAKDHASSYNVYYVYDINSTPPKFIILPSEFWNDVKYRMKEIVEKYEFTF